MTRVLIVDDHPLYREGVIGALTRRLPGAEVLGAATVLDGLAVMDSRADLELVLIDLHLPDRDGFDALALYGERHPGVARVLISGLAIDEPTLERAMRAGASGFIPKALSVGRMIDAIVRVLEGGIFVPALIGDDRAPFARPLDEATTSRSSAANDFDSASQAISVRQLEVLALLGQGRSNKDIARRLDIAERTVKAHATRVFEVLGASNRTQAVLAAQRLGLLAA
jgi:two-component system, NarL family, nitrate/nitrite response regulator NarL